MDKSAPSKESLEKAQEIMEAESIYIAIALEFDRMHERDEVTEKLAKALDFMYRYFVMPGHPERAKDCPNKDCPFCKADEALAAYRERMGR